MYSFEHIASWIQRLDLATNFAIKLFKSPRCLEFFEPVQTRNTRNEHFLVKEIRTNTARCYNAPHSYLARLVNKNKQKIQNMQKWKLIKLNKQSERINFCYMWTMEALPSSLFCSKHFYYIEALCTVSYHMLRLIKLWYIYMAHHKVNSPKHLKGGEIYFWDPPQNRTKMPFFAIFFTYSY